MKKYAKYLMLLLALAVLTALFAYPASAETTTSGFEVAYTLSDGTTGTVTIESSDLTAIWSNSTLTANAVVGANSSPYQLYGTGGHITSIKLLGDNEVYTGKNITAKTNQSFELYLQGNTLNMSGYLEMGDTENAVYEDGTPFRIVGGTNSAGGHGKLVRKSGQYLFKTAPGRVLLVDGVDIEWKMFYVFKDTAARLYHFKDCNLTLKGNGLNFDAPDASLTEAVDYTPTLFFENTSVSTTSGKLLYLSAGENNLNVYFDGNSRLSVTGSAKTLDKASNLTGTQNFYLAKGFKLNNAPINIAETTGDCVTTVNYVDSVAIANGAVTVGDFFAPAGYMPSGDSSLPYRIDSYEKKDNTVLSVFSGDGRFVFYTTESAEFNLSALSIFPQDSVVCVYKDVNLIDDKDAFGSGITGLKTGITFNLNGNTITNGISSLKVDGLELAFNNGTLSYELETGAFLSGGSLTGTKVTLSDIQIVSSGSGMETLGGEWIVNGGSITSSGTAVAIVGANYPSSPLSVYLTGVTVNSQSALSHTATENADAVITLDNCGVTVSNELLAMDGSGDYNGKIALNIKNSAVEAEGALFDSLYDALTVTLSNTKFNKEPTLSKGTLIIAKGETVAVTDDETFKYAVMKPAYAIRAGLTLYTDFTVNFYLPKDTTVSEITVNGVKYTVADLTDTVNLSSGEYYSLKVEGIAANAAADIISLNAVYTVDGVTHMQDSTYSISAYANTVLTSNTLGESAKALVASAMRYVNASYAYTDTVVPAGLAAVLNSEEYKKSLPAEIAVKESTSDIGEANAAIASVQLNLDSAMKLRFNLNSAYTGTLTVATYKADGTTVRSSVTYIIENGVTESGNTYIDLPMRAYELYDELLYIEGSAFEGQGTYDLAAYINNFTSEDEALKALLSALYSYCAAADFYNASN